VHGDELIGHVQVLILVGWVSGLWIGCVCSRTAVIFVKLVLTDITTVAIIVSMATASVKWISTGSRVGFIKAIFGEFLVEGIAVNAQTSGSFNLNPVTALKNLLDQLSLDAANDPIMQIIGVGPSGANALSNKLAAKRGLITVTSRSDWPRRRLTAKLWWQVLDC
jgi:hypothetical protein